MSRLVGSNGSNTNDDANVAVVAHHDNGDDLTTVDKVSTDGIAIIFGFLTPEDIMRLRQVCSRWKDAAKKTIVPPSITIVVNSVDKYRAMAAMTEWLPNLQQLSICTLGWGHKYRDGEDPDEY